MGLAVATGASTGIGRELARCAAADGHDLVLAADDAEIEAAAAEFRAQGRTVDAVRADLATADGVDRLTAVLRGRPVDLLMANAGAGLGHAFLDQDEADIDRVIALNVTGTTDLLHRIVPAMRERGRGRILVTGSITGYMPGSFHAVYNATKAFIDILTLGLREELRGSGVTVTCLMPGPTETDFFDRAGLEDTPLGEASKDDPGDVARAGYAAMMKGASGVTPGFLSSAQRVFASVLPKAAVAALHRRMAEPEDHRNG